MVEIEQARSFLFKLFATILIFCLCHIILELLNGVIAENEENRFKRSVEENKEILLDLPGQMKGDHFKRTKRLNVSTKRFVPTEFWQEIQSGQEVPSGLHYRINLETGKKEAKLLDKNENKSKEISTINRQDVHQHENPISNHLNEIGSKSRIEKLQKDFEKFKFNEKDTELNKESNLNNWRSMDEIKKEFEDLKIKLSTDTQNVHQLLDRYGKTVNNDEKIIILKDLEYILHQYDVSGDFVKMNGLEVLKDDFLNNKNNEIQSLISLTLGSASSANPPVKVAIIKAKIFDHLIMKLNSEKDLKLNLKTIFAISQIVRQFPYAQQQFVEKQGLRTFKQFFDGNLQNYKNYSIPNLTKIQTKITSLLSDLIDEYHFTLSELNELKNTTNDKQNSKEINDLEEKMKQYKLVNLEQNIIDEGFCSIIANNLNNSSFDVKEKVLKSMYSFRSICRSDFKMHLNDLIKIKQELNDKIQTDDSDDYFQNLFKLTQNLIEFLNN